MSGTSSRRRLYADLTLLAVALIWGSAFVAQRIAAAEMGFLTFNGWRFLVGAAAVLPFAILSRSKTIVPWHRLDLTDRRRTAAGLLLAGVFLTLGSAFQQAGLEFTSAGNAGFITGLYVVLIPLFLALGWHRMPRPVIWAAALLAALGLYLLSTGGSMQVNRGDGLVLISAVFWALHVILIDWMVRRMDILRFALGQYLVCGLTSLAFGLALEEQSRLSLINNWPVIAYTGLVSIGLGYTLQAAGQRVAPPADAAIILSMEAVFAALAGWLILDERLSNIQLLGCGLMFLGMLLAQSEIILGGKYAQTG
jgi:drug/metabolite transporter (DMT)-like permease